MDRTEMWQRYCKYICVSDSVGMTLDYSRMDFSDADMERIGVKASRALDAMKALEEGEIANPDENRMVGHYWLRAPQIAPNEEIKQAICSTLDAIKSFTSDVHSGKIYPPTVDRFRNVILVGIGGSALGPQFIDDALASTDAPMNIWFCDNTDPDGIDRILQQVGSNLASTLTVVISKSGGTKETRNGMLEVAAAYKNAGLEFSDHAVAITAEGSALFDLCKKQDWVAFFPMWDWVGGRTSVMSAVGLLPAALRGLDLDQLLAGAARMDSLTRSSELQNNPAAIMAMMWYRAGEELSLRDMVVLPYKDRLVLFAKYLQQLVMESLGKELDLDGNTVLQGLTVYGNKGSTDQHAYVQQLREGLCNFFATFIRVLHDRDGASIEVEPSVTTGDFLHGFLLGTREALSEKGRQSMTITVQRADAATIGAMIALFERTVGLYAAMVNINAYHQPGVEAGKKAAGRVIELQCMLTELFASKPGKDFDPQQAAEALDRPDDVEWISMILERLAASSTANVVRTHGTVPCNAKYSARPK